MNTLPMLLFFLAGFVTIVFFHLFKRKWFKGLWGELLVNLLARCFLDKKTYHVIHNVTLPAGDGSTQIDHIIVSVYGVFVIETKNMKGFIFGEVREKLWTQKIEQHSHLFQNPLHQNFKHLKVLQDILHLHHSKLFSLVVFIGSSTFKTSMPANVTRGIGYVRYVKSQKKRRLDESQVQEIIKIIERVRYARNRATHKRHIEHVKAIQLKKQPVRKLCPECKSEMLLRTVKTGKYSGQQFWGCSKFPQCKGTLST